MVNEVNGPFQWQNGQMKTFNLRNTIEKKSHSAFFWGLQNVSEAETCRTPLFLPFVSPLSLNLPFNHSHFEEPLVGVWIFTHLISHVTHYIPKHFLSFSLCWMLSKQNLNCTFSTSLEENCDRGGLEGINGFRYMILCRMCLRGCVAACFKDVGQVYLVS